MIYPFWRAKRFVQTPADSTFPPAALHRSVGTIEVAKQHGSPVDSKNMPRGHQVDLDAKRNCTCGSWPSSWEEHRRMQMFLCSFMIFWYLRMANFSMDWMIGCQYIVYVTPHWFLSTRPTRTVHTVAMFQLSLAVQLRRHGGCFNGTKGCRKRSPWWRWNGGIFLGCPGTPWNRNLGNQPILRSLRCHLQDRGKMVPCI